MRSLIPKLFFTLFIFLAVTPSKATHVMGSGTAWECLGNDSFKVTLYVYRDCNGVNLSNINLTASCSTSMNKITSSTQSPGKGVDITPVCESGCSRCTSGACSFPYGVKKYTVTYILDLSSAPKSCCKVTLSWSQCCRSNAITTGLANKNFYSEATLNRCVTPCDNSPVFSRSPFSVLCNDQLFKYDPWVYDNDKDSAGNPLDSLYVSFARPLTGVNNYGSYNGNYTYQKPLYYYGFPNTFYSPPRGIHLNNQTGELTFMPKKKQQTVMVFSIKEYRNGKLIGEVRRDMQVIVIDCQNNVPPVLKGINSHHKKTTSVCAGSKAKFSIQAIDINLQDSVSFLFQQGNLPGKPNTKVTNRTLNKPKWFLYWNTKSSYARIEPYYFYLTAHDDYCPVNGKTTQLYKIRVSAPPQVSVKTSKKSCGKVTFEVTPQTKGTIEYQWKGTANINDTARKFTHQFPAPGDYPYQLKYTYRGCSRIYHDTIHMDPFFHVDAGADTLLCRGDSLALTPQILNASGNVTYHWNTGQKTKNITLNRLDHDSVLIFTASDTSCTISDSVNIKVSQTKVHLSKQITRCYGDTVELTPRIKYDPGQWIRGNWIYIEGDNSKADYTWYKTGKIGFLSLYRNFSVTHSGNYLLNLYDEFGCFSTDTASINFGAEIIEASAQPSTICPGDTTILQAKTGNLHNGFIRWKALNNGRDTTGNNIKITPGMDRKYLLVTGSLLNYQRCRDSQIVNIHVKPYPVPEVLPFPAICQSRKMFRLKDRAQPPGGYWNANSPAGSVVKEGYFYPAQSGSGKFRLWYIFKDTASGCIDSASGTLEVKPVKPADPGKDKLVCTSQKQVLLNGDTTSDQWTGNGITQTSEGWVFKPLKAGLGTHKLFLTHTNPNNGCKSHDSVAYEVVPSPTAHAGKDQSVCSNDTPVLLYGKPDSGIWKGPGIYGSNIFVPDSVQGGQSYMLYYIYTNQHGCSAIDTINMKVHKAPKADFTANRHEGKPPLVIFFYDGSVGQITAREWDPGLQSQKTFTEKNPVVIYKKPGKYTVRLVILDQNGCMDSISRKDFITVKKPTGKPSRLQDLTSQIHPNPAGDHAMIPLPDELQLPVHLKLFSTGGRTVRNLRIDVDQQIRLERKMLDPGTYILILRGQDGNVSYGKLQFR